MFSTGLTATVDEPVMVTNDVAPNPDFASLRATGLKPGFWERRRNGR